MSTLQRGGLRRRPSALIAILAALGLAAGSAPSASLAQSQEPAASPSPDTQGMTQLGSTIVNVAADVSPAVVTILTLAPGRTLGSGGGLVQGAGSGVIIDPSGIILTNRHVVLDSDAAVVALADGRELEGRVAGVDTYTDLAFVQVEGEDLPTASLGDSASLQVGQLAIAIGSPLGRFANSVSVGVVSGLSRSIEVADPTNMNLVALRHLIQTDAAINPGNSGGALVDDQGRLIGINTAAAGGAEGIGFALPIDIAKPIIEQILAGEDIARPWMGVQYVDIDLQLAAVEGLPVNRGAWLTGQGEAIIEGSPADEAGLRRGDIILAVDGEAVTPERPLDLILLTYAPGRTIDLRVLRDGEERDVELTLGARPAEAAG